MGWVWRCEGGGEEGGGEGGGGGGGGDDGVVMVEKEAPRRWAWSVEPAGGKCSGRCSKNCCAAGKCAAGFSPMLRLGTMAGCRN